MPAAGPSAWGGLTPADLLRLRHEPLTLKDWLWPPGSEGHFDFYDKELELVDSVVRNDWTFCTAGNQLGKDFTAAFLVLWFFLTRSPCKVVTTSAKEDHLRVLWGEIGRFVRQAVVPLDHRRGGPLRVLQQELRKPDRLTGRDEAETYAIGQVASLDTMAALGGHHLPRPGGWPATLCVYDETSSIRDEVWTVTRPWAHRALAIGNCWPCDNFFKHAVKGRPGTEDHGGDLPKPGRAGAAGRHYRKVVRIRAADSPNVRRALAQQGRGEEPDGLVVCPGVKTWEAYVRDRKFLNPAEQSVVLDADWYEGAALYLFPAEVLAACADLAAVHDPRVRPDLKRRKARGVGVDPAEGGDRTALCAVDEWGVLALESHRTPNTAVIPRLVRDFARRWLCRPEDVLFDAGGGGKQHADRLREEGFPCRSVGFGESPAPPLEAIPRGLDERQDDREGRYAYTSRRVQLYAELSLLCDPAAPFPRAGKALAGFGIPRRLAELHRQLAPLRRDYNGEGRLVLPPKRRGPGVPKGVKTLEEILGCSPDESDALALACHAMLHPERKALFGPLWDADGNPVQLVAG